MTVVYFVLPTLLVVLSVLVAVAPWGAWTGAGLVLQVLPYMVAHLFLVRGKGFVPSPVMFLAGLAMDVGTGGPLGFWALIYLFGVLITRQLPGGLVMTHAGRFSGLLLVVFALSAAQVGVASIYQLKWIDWHGVVAGTVIAGVLTGLADLAWRERRSERDINVTARGGGSRHV